MNRLLLMITFPFLLTGNVTQAQPEIDPEFIRYERGVVVRQARVRLKKYSHDKPALAVLKSYGLENIYTQPLPIIFDDNRTFSTWSSGWREYK